MIIQVCCWINIKNKVKAILRRRMRKSAYSGCILLPILHISDFLRVSGAEWCVGLGLEETRLCCRRVLLD
jgi:hypothetical protein